MRWSRATRAKVLDALVFVVGLALAVSASWFRSNTVGTPVTGPLWLRVAFPLLLAGPLLWRRRAPLAAYAVTVSTLVVQGLVTVDSPEGLQIIYCVGVTTFSVGAHPDRRRAWAGLGVGLAAFVVYAGTNHDIRSGQSGQLWSGAFFAVALVAAWLAGVYVANRRRERADAERRQALEAETRRAVTEERSRLARELHDVVAHNLSVVVLQAAGARAQGGDAADEALEKIERSGRESLVEMRRLLGILRDETESAGLLPQPGIVDLDDLVRRVRAAGLDVDVAVRDPRGQAPRLAELDLEGLSPALQLSVYRIVQESLTNVLKHGGGARARVTLAIDADAVVVDVVDDGAGASSPTEGGNGIIGMRERVAVFAGTLDAGPAATGGFAVHAVLPREHAG